jgi:hypothetical protein
MPCFLVCCTVAAAMAAAPPVDLADITVRVISAKTGRPMVEKHVNLSVGAGGGPHGGALRVFDGWEYTDSDGVAVFHVPKTPKWGWITVMGNYPDVCSPFTNTADEVMNVGVSKYGCPHRPVKKFALPPKPGQIVIYVPEYTPLERFLYLPWNY